MLLCSDESLKATDTGASVHLLTSVVITYLTFGVWL